MSFGNATETDILNLLMIGTALSWNAATQLDIHLHTADPGEAGISTTNEATYTGYAVVTVNRSAADWTVTGNQAVNDNLIQFVVCSGGSNTITHASITPAGSTQIIAYHALGVSLPVVAGIQPQFGAGTLTLTLD